MSNISTKFSVGDVAYTFDNTSGVIYRHVIKEIQINIKSMDSEITYNLINSSPTVPSVIKSNVEYEQNLYSEVEVKDIANTWLINKSTSIFSNAGL